MTFDNTRTSQSNGDILLVIEIPGTEVEVDREKDIIGTKIIIDVIVEIKVSRDLILLMCCKCVLYTIISVIIIAMITGNRDHRSSSHQNRRRHRSRSRSHK